MQGADGRAFLAISKPLAHGGWIATIEDITERRKLEQERDRNYAFLSQIIDHIPTQITVKDVHDRRYLLANRVAEAHFGMSRDAIVGKTAHDLFRKPRRCHHGRRRKGPAIPTACSWTNISGKARRWAAATSPPGGSGFAILQASRYVINVVDDVTERRRADEKIAHLAHYDA